MTTLTPTTINLNKTHFRLWMSLAIFSAVSLVSMTNFLEHKKDLDDGFDHEDWTRSQRAVVSVTTVSLVLSVLGFISHVVNRDQFLGAKFGLVLSVLALWCGILPTIMDHNHDFAVMESGEVRNHNMFFASWGALIVALMLFTEHFRKIMNFEDCHKNMPHWMGLSAASLVVMCDACRLFRDWCEDIDWMDADGDFCRRNVFGLVLGATSFVLAGIATCIPMPTVVEQSGSLVLFVAWCFGFAYLTFEEGTALAASTTYFGIWAAIFFSMNMVVPAVFDVFTRPAATPINEEAPALGKGTEGAVHPKTGGAVGDIEEEEIAAE